MSDTVVQAPVWRMGFRPFFLVGVVHAILFILYWVGGLYGLWTFPGTLNLVTVHMHEMVYGFVIAIIGGFLLTASANWTSTRGLHGEGLMILLGFWLLGRVGILLALFGLHPMWIWLDIAFIPGVMLAIGPSLWRARKWNNISILFWLLLMVVGHALFLLEVSWVWTGWGRRGLYLGLGSAIFLVILVGGRILPYFTRNYLRDPEIKKWERMDQLGLACATVYVGTLFVLGTHHTVTGIAAVCAGLSNLLRMRYWKSWNTYRTPLLWILHLAYIWLIVAFFLHAAATQAWVPWSSAVHAFTVGGIGCFVLGMISRVSLGHTGRPLRAEPLTVVAYVILVLTSLLRVFASVLPGSWYHNVIALSGVGWSIAFALFLWVYFPVLTSPRADGRDG